ncbi:Similar to hypothetical protein AN2620.2 [Aspergillus nidulans FGSC A4]; acc. no. XP_660224 [Pyronema omphalodes CBS 100304]|uniref:Magnesium transport protein CorA acc. no n=1 Tax=Pyronema omphalodes (strain CBS 100304) TaxID=1076935 RepID=U4LWN8_PYROM|nr:Similar to hypothetical protein AN2620.2 [Aspergillus nidulans FGSC A4]; acc. no. XP_660224 [Pyronema omphalodes CBS 100304]
MYPLSLFFVFSSLFGCLDSSAQYPLNPDTSFITPQYIKTSSISQATPPSHPLSGDMSNFNLQHKKRIPLSLGADQSGTPGIYASLYQQALDRARFLPQAAGYIEGWCYTNPDSSDPDYAVIDENHLPVGRIEGWIDGENGIPEPEDNMKRVGGFRLLITYSTNPTKKSQGFGRDIPYTRSTFENLVEKFKLPKQSLELVSNSSSGVFAHTLNLTTGLIHYWDWYSGLFNMFLSLLRSDPGRCMNPYFFPITFLKAHNWWSESFRSHLNDLMTSFADLDDYEAGNISDTDGLGGGPGGKSERDIRNTMNEISRFIHNLPTENSHAVFQGNTCEMLLKELEGKKGQEELYEVLGLLRFQIAGHTEAIGNLRTRIEARNSMLYNRMSQTESRLNYQIAKAARMDSYDMRAIALLTTFFLPGTFIATFFGAQLVKFDDINSAMKIYWALTIPLTFLVVSAWQFWSWMHKRHDSAKESGGRDAQPVEMVQREKGVQRTWSSHNTSLI